MAVDRGVISRCPHSPWRSTRSTWRSRDRDKTYGMCESCGKPIPKARLRALPYARLCVSCKSGGCNAAERRGASAAANALRRLFLGRAPSPSWWCFCPSRPADEVVGGVAAVGGPHPRRVEARPPAHLQLRRRLQPLLPRGGRRCWGVSLSSPCLSCWVRHARVQSTAIAVALGLVVGGALGNLSDRVFRSNHGPSVIDFIALCISGRRSTWLSFRIRPARRDHRGGLPVLGGRSGWSRGCDVSGAGDRGPGHRAGGSGAGAGAAPAKEDPVVTGETSRAGARAPRLGSGSIVASPCWPAWRGARPPS